jgi:hypothetical protein
MLARGSAWTIDATWATSFGDSQPLLAINELVRVLAGAGLKPSEVQDLALRGSWLRFLRDGSRAARERVNRAVPQLGWERHSASGTQWEGEWANWRSR